MNTELLAILCSGQLILVLWQVYKEVMERKEKRKANAKAKADGVDAIREMVFKLYRDSMKHKILDIYPKILSYDEDLSEALMLLQDDMEFYLAQGGNGLVKEMYLRLATYVRDNLGDRYYLLMVVDSIPEFSRQG